MFKRKRTGAALASSKKEELLTRKKPRLGLGLTKAGEASDSATATVEEASTPTPSTVAAKLKTKSKLALGSKSASKSTSTSQSTSELTSKTQTTAKDKSKLKSKSGRKQPSTSTSTGRRLITSQDDLGWKTISVPLSMFDVDALSTPGNGGNQNAKKGRKVDIGMEGFMGLEEVEGVEVVYEEGETGRVARFNVREREDDEDEDEDEEEMIVEDEVLDEEEDDEEAERDSEEEDQDIDTDQSEEEDVSMSSLSPTPTAFDTPALLPLWSSIPLHPTLHRALHSKSFLQPTPIQEATLPLALKGRDVVGIAQTGSGKTLAYGLPILDWFLRVKEGSKDKGGGEEGRRRTKALVLAPTRELALQVSSHLNEVLSAMMSSSPQDADEDSSKGKSRSKAKAPPLVSIAALVGGMSPQKQKRILNRGVDILVATPGRLWETMQEDEELNRDVGELRFLVVDEADRMVEAGHFVEMEGILRRTRRRAEESEEDGAEGQAQGEEGGEREEEEEEGMQGVEEGVEEEEEEVEMKKDDLQTFVFSATLSKDLQQNLKHRKIMLLNNRKNKKSKKKMTTLDDLVSILDFRDVQPEVIDLSQTSSFPSTLLQSQLPAIQADKDVFLYYLLLRYPGKTLVFLSSIDALRRLHPVLTLLQIKTSILHSGMEQRARLKNLERFRSPASSSGSTNVLLATDVAARGLDIPNVQHVVHFQPPRSAETYIHRCGRTARGGERGLSVLFFGPEESTGVKALWKALGVGEEPGMFDVDLGILGRLRERVMLARKVDGVCHKDRKVKWEKGWERNAAEILGVELSEDENGSDGQVQMNQNRHQAEIDGLKRKLDKMLQQQVLVSGISARYITSGLGAAGVVEQLLGGKGNDHLLGLERTQAVDDMNLRGKKGKKVAVKSGKRGKSQKTTASTASKGPGKA